MNRFLVVTVGLICAAASSGFSQDRGLIRKAIDAGNAKYIEAFAERDSNELAGVYDESGARFNPKGAYARGRVAIASQVGEFMHSVTGPIKVKIETEDLWIVDDVAYETGKYSYAFTPTGKAEERQAGHYVTVWKKQADGGWKISADMGVPSD